MSIFTPYLWGTSKTPLVISTLILVTCLVSIFVTLANPLFIYLGVSGPYQLLTLSAYGMQHYYLWQPFSYLFTQTSLNGIDLFYLISLAFNMYVLWAFGSPVHERMGTKHFLGLYLGSGAFAGIIACLAMPLIGQYAVFSGPSAALLATFIVWAMFFPESQLTFFPYFPVKAKWLTAGVLGIITLTCLSQLDLIHFIIYIVATLCAYLYSVIVFNLCTPFTATHRVDSRIALFFRRFHKKETKKNEAPASKIYDIKSGDPILTDDAFVDQMLSKISKEGEKSLSMSERRRMKQISERKMKEKSNRNEL